MKSRTGLKIFMHWSHIRGGGRGCDGQQKDFHVAIITARVRSPREGHVFCLFVCPKGDIPWSLVLSLGGGRESCLILSLVMPDRGYPHPGNSRTQYAAGRYASCGNAGGLILLYWALVRNSQLNHELENPRANVSINDHLQNYLRIFSPHYHLGTRCSILTFTQKKENSRHYCKCNSIWNVVHLTDMWWT